MALGPEGPAAGASCGACDTPLPADARFCTDCGRPQDPSQPEPASAEPTAAGRPAGRPTDTPPELRPRLVECEVCGASNAASRPLCARCGNPLRDEIPGGDALPDEAAATPRTDQLRRPRGMDTSPVLLALVVLAGLVTAGVLLALVTSQVTREDVPAVSAGVAVVGASASSSLGGHPATAAVDGDPMTAWVEGDSGSGAGESLVLELADAVEVRRILVWNGDQRSEERYRSGGRASALLVDVGDRQFRVDLLDINGPQGVDLPVGVIADVLRLTVDATVEGDHSDDLAISEVVIEAQPG